MLTDVSTSETITESEYNKILSQVRSWLINNPDINYIVTTKGVPIRTGSGMNCGFNSTTWKTQTNCLSVDSKLVYDLGFISTGASFSGIGKANNYYSKNEKFSHAKYGGYLVTRLDGVSTEDIKQLVDSSTSAQKNGLSGSYLINCYGSNGDYYGWCAGAKNSLTAQNKLVEYNTVTFVMNRINLAGYVSYGSNAGANFSNSSAWNLAFNPGALTETFVSTSGRTFNSYWRGGQSLVTDMIKYKATGVKGYVYEPYLPACSNVNVLWDRYLAGYNLADSYYMSSHYVNWMDIVIGDPKTYVYANENLK